MNQQNQQPEKQNKEHRFDPELLERGLRCDRHQYKFLKLCSEKGEDGIKRWNNWREKHLDYNIQDVLLEGGDFSNWHLEGINLGTNREYGRTTPEVYLKKAKFNHAHFEGAKFYFAHMEGAELYKVYLEGAKLDFAYLNKSFLLGAHLENAWLQCAKLHNANVCNADLKGTVLVDSELEGGQFDNAYLQKAKFQKATVNGKTSFCYCKVDYETDFCEVGLDTCRIDPATKQLLEYNIRRKNWEEWYKEHKLTKCLVKPFWKISDYGISTMQILKTFFQLAIIFAGFYLGWGLIDYYIIGIKDNPGIVSNLFVLERTHEIVSPFLVPLRAVYFSIVTMTTLGFGDMYANSQSILGHILLTIQVILGYVLLGALVTRFAVLFTAGGPAGEFDDEKKENEKK